MIPCTLRQLFRFPFFSLGGSSLLLLLLPCMVGIVPFDCKAFSLLFELFTSFSGHRPAQRECVRMGLRSHARCHPYPILQPVKVGHTTGVYDTDSFLIVTWFLLRPQEQISESAVRRDLRSEKTGKSNHLQMSLQRQHVLLSYLKTLSVGPAGV